MKHLMRLLEVLLPITAVILIVFQIVVSNELAALGKQLGRLDAQAREAMDTKEALSIQVASASSLLTLRERAETLGFIEPTAKQIVNLSRETPVAALDVGKNSSLHPVE